MDSNRAAAGAVDSFMTSGEPALAICGPAGSGKSHLAHILAADNGAAVRLGADLDAAFDDDRLLVVIDDVGTAPDPKRLFALIEERRAKGLRLALAGRGRPADWAQGLKDLVTRLEAMLRVSLDEPDEELMRAVIDQRFRDRQWRAAPKVSAYAAPRLPRTFAAAGAFVEAVGAAAIAEGTPINLALARKVIDNLSVSGSRN